jgi:Cytochrome c7 and related cytochrome c
MGRGPFAMGTIGAVVAAVVLVLAAITAPASAAAPPPGDAQCLACHGMTGLTMPLGSGGTLSLHIPGDAFAKSVHSAMGCAGCHTDINLASHPGSVKPIASRRQFSIGMAQICGTCHKDQSQQWNTSVHAALVREGDANAPICTSCHSPHTVMKGVAEAMDTVPCKTCHGAIFTAYAGSVHGVLRSGGVTQAPLCFSCHGAHAVHVPSEVQGLRDVCLGCHKEAIQAHRTWLPNVELHFGAVSCPACHVPHAKRRVDLVLFNSTTQKAASEPVGVPEFESPNGSATAKRPGLDPATLFALLKALNRPGVEDKTVIKGRLEVSTAVEAHQIVPSTEAISDCSTCHRQGANPFQSVVVSVAGPAGIPILYGASKAVLSSAFSIQSIGGFYAIGGTRITFLDVLLVLALLGGIGGPVVHLIARWFFRRYFNHAPHEQRKG